MLREFFDAKELTEEMENFGGGSFFRGGVVKRS
jgi:hypothetical protein